MTTQPTMPPPTPLNTFKTPMIHAQLARVMEDLDAVPKDQVNSGQGGFRFRGIDQIYNTLNPILKKHEVTLSARVVGETRATYTTAKGATMQSSVLHVELTAWATDGSSRVLAVAAGEGSDAGDKATSKAWSIAVKYGLITAFCIPTVDQEDGDRATPEERGPARPSAPPQQTPPAAPASGRALIGQRLMELGGGDTTKAQAVLASILPGRKSVAQLPDDDVWRMQVALALMNGCANDVAAARKFAAEQLGTPWVDQMTPEHKAIAVAFIKDGTLPAAPGQDPNIPF